MKRERTATTLSGVHLSSEFPELKIYLDALELKLHRVQLEDNSSKVKLARLRRTCLQSASSAVLTPMSMKSPILLCQSCHHGGENVLHFRIRFIPPEGQKGLPQKNTAEARNWPA